MRKVGVLCVLLLLCATASAGTRVENVRMWPAPDHTRVVFDVSGPVEHKVFRLRAPERVVIDLRDARLMADVTQPVAADRQVERVRTSARGVDDLRVVLDLKRRVRAKSFLLKPNRKYGHRLVVDLYAAAERVRGGDPVARPRTQPPRRLRDVVIAIDPGHGGEDPGASGRRGTLEKDVVFAIAKKLEALLARERGMRPLLIRTADYYVGLRKRMQIARDAKADMFVSIHADAFRDRRVGGMSVYVLSRNGASSEAAKWLAARENAADLIGGVSLDDKDDLLASVLLDLSQTATLGASADAAAKVLVELKQLGKVHKRRVQRAGFMVLKSPDIPSFMVETAFITNPREERKLRDRKHQMALARAIARGLRAYFRKNAPAGTLLAARRHVIARGETLSRIATRYNVSVDRLRAENALAHDQLAVGQVLHIPLGSGS